MLLLVSLLYNVALLSYWGMYSAKNARVLPLEVVIAMHAAVKGATAAQPSQSHEEKTETKDGE